MIQVESGGRSLTTKHPRRTLYAHFRFPYIVKTAGAAIFAPARVPVLPYREWRATVNTLRNLLRQNVFLERRIAQHRAVKA